MSNSSAELRTAHRTQVQATYHQTPLASQRVHQNQQSKAVTSSSAKTSAARSKQQNSANVGPLNVMGQPASQSLLATPQATLKGKTQLARDYYVLQAFVQQPHLHSTASSAHQVQLAYQAQEGRLASAAEGTTSQKRTKLSSADKATGGSKSGKTLPTHQAYYTYAAHPQQPTGGSVSKHAKADSIHSAGSLQSGNQRRAGAGSSTTNASEPQAFKRSVHSAHHGTVSNRDTASGNHLMTPKAPQTATIFRRKWGGASSTKSQKSISSNRSAAAPAQAHSQQVLLSHPRGDSTDKPRHPQNRSERNKKEKSKQSLVQKAHAVDQVKPLRDNFVSESAFAGAKIALEQQFLQVNAFETPPVTQHKTLRANSNEIKANQIDFTQLARNQMATYSQSTKKMTSEMAAALAASLSPIATHTQHLTSTNSQMPPKPVPVGSSAKTSTKKARRKSKSKSQTRAHTHGAPTAVHNSTSNFAPASQVKPADRNGASNNGLASQQSSNQMRTGDSLATNASKSKKLRSLLQTATASTDQMLLQAAHQQAHQVLHAGPDSSRGNTNPVQTATPSRNSGSQAKTREDQSQQNAATFSKGPPSGPSPFKRNAQASSGKVTSHRAGAGGHPQQSNQRKNMTPVIQSSDRLPPTAQTMAKTSQNLLNMKSEQTETMLSLVSNTCQSHQGFTNSHDRPREVEPMGGASSLQGKSNGVPPTKEGKSTKQSSAGKGMMLKSHRVQLTTPSTANQVAVGHHGGVPNGRSGALRKRNRSASNQKQTYHSSHANVNTVTSLNKDKDSGLTTALMTASQIGQHQTQTESKRQEKDGGGNGVRAVKQRKKSTTRRNKSIKRVNLHDHGTSGGPSGPEAKQKSHAEGNHRGRSRERPSGNLIQGSGQERYYSPQVQPLMTGQAYSAFRMRTLKPKKAKERIATVDHDLVMQQHRNSKHGASVSLERDPHATIHVGLLNVSDGKNGGAGNTVLTTQQHMLQSASAGNSVCSQKTFFTQKESRQATRNPSSQKQKMLTNIQNQVLQGTRVLAGKRSKQEAAQAKKAAQLSEKRRALEKATADDNIKGGTTNGAAGSHTVDLMKASLMTDIRIETRLRQSNDINVTPSQSSMKSASKHPPSEKKLRRKTRSISSDEHMPKQSSSNRKTSARDKTEPTEQSQSKIIDLGDSKNDSPKFLLSLRQLEKLLFSTQKISQQLQKSASQKKTTSTASAQAKKAIIQSSLKVLHQDEAAKTHKAGQQQQLKQLGSSRAEKKTKRSAGALKEKDARDNKFITIQPTSLQVFNAISEDPSSNQGTQDQLKSQSQSQSVGKLQSSSAHISSQKLRTKSQERPDVVGQHATSNHLLAVTAKRIQDKISRQSSNLLSLVELQKMRANRMAQAHRTTSNATSAAAKHERAVVLKGPSDQRRRSSDLGHDVQSNGSHEKQALVAGKESAGQRASASPGRNNNLAYREYSNDAALIETDEQEQQQPSVSCAVGHEESSSAQRLHNLIYAKLETRQNQSKISPPSSKVHSHDQVEDCSQQTGAGEYERVSDQSSSRQIKRQLEPEILRNANMAAVQKGDLQYERSETASPDMIQVEIEPRSTSSRPDSQLHDASQVNDCDRSSYLHRVEDHKQEEFDQEQRTGEPSKVESSCSVKQPSLRQITSSHTSRSLGGHRLNRQGSADLRQSQDPNASITLSRILLETSMQQSEKGKKASVSNGGAAAQAAVSQSQAFLNQQMMQQARDSNLTSPNNDDAHNNDGMSYQSLNSAQVLSETNQVKKQDSGVHLTKHMPRSFTNPEKLNPLTHKAQTAKSIKSPFQHFIADEVWPNSSSRRQRTSSITSLTNSTPGSRTLEQLQHQVHTQSLSPSIYHQVSPPPQRQAPNRQLTISPQSQERLLPELASGGHNHLQSSSLVQGLTPDQQSMLIQQKSPLRYEQDSRHLATQPEEPHVQDQQEGHPQQSDDDGSSRLQEPHSPLAQGVSREQETEAMMSRGTSSPDRRRSPLSKTQQSQGLLMGTEGGASALHPIQLDNSTSFNNDIEYSEEPLSVPQSGEHRTEDGGLGGVPTGPPRLTHHHHRDFASLDSAAAVQQMMTRSERADESYEEAPYEKSQNEGLNLILFQGMSTNNANVRDSNNEEGDDLTGAQVRQDLADGAPEQSVQSQQNLLSSINSQAENDASSPPMSASQDQQQQPQVSTPAPEPYSEVPQRAPLETPVLSDLENNPSQLAAIEDVLRVAPQTPEGVISLVSVDSDKMAGMLHNNFEGSSSRVLTRSPRSENKRQTLEQKAEQGKTLVTVPLDSRLVINSSPLDMIAHTTKSAQNTIKSESLTPIKQEKNVGAQGTANEARSILEKFPSNLTVSGPNQQSESDYPDNLAAAVDRAISPSEMLLKCSVQSQDLEFEEAVNTELSAPTNSPGAAKTPTPGSRPPSLPKVAILATNEPTLNSPSLATQLTPTSAESRKTGVPPNAKLYDIDSLNEIKKAYDLSTKKVEITNHIFEMLVGEIKQSLFPLRDEEEEDEGGVETGRAKRKQKRKVARRVKKPNTLPKIKEIKDGQPVDMCLKRIQLQVKMRHSMGSIELGGSLSATQSLSLSKEDDGASYLDQTKSKEQLEASSQFHRIELRKQEQLDMLQRQIALAEESQTTSKREEDDLKQLQSNLRGIKTTTEVVDQYLSTLFDTLISAEQDFLDNLATPFALNPIQELINLQVLSRQARQLAAPQNRVSLSPQPQLGSPGRKMLQDVRSSSQYGSNNHEKDLEVALFGFSQHQQPVLSVEIYLDIERRKDYVLLADSLSDINLSIEESLNQSETNANEGADSSTLNAQVAALRSKKQKEPLVENQSMLAEWENIHNKVLFDAVNDALDEFRPYGLRGPPAPWSGQTRALTYRYSQNAKEVLQQVRDKVVGLSKTFGGALANSELLREYHIRGPLEQDKLQMLREERLAIMMMQDVEENQHKWDNLERQDTGVKVDIAELILEQLTAEIAEELGQIEQRRTFEIA